VAGGVYVLLAVLVHFLGAERIVSFFPPIVTGPVIMVIGLNLAPTAINMASSNWLLALLGFAVVAYVNIFLKGFAKSLPVLIGLAVSYAVASLVTLAGMAPLVDFAPIAEAAWIGLPKFVMAQFDIGAIMLVAPVAVCTMVEHMGDIIAVGTIVNRDFIKDPGLPRTLFGDGVATSISAMFGGPANTTYSENTGVLALTRAYNPAVMRIAACFALVLGICPKLGALISTIPGPIIGGISIILFGMIASVGARTLVENQVDFQQSRNLIIAAVILVLGIGGASIPFALGSVSVNLQGMALASIVGIILNKILPGAQKYQKNVA
jgi:uracil permease